MYIILSLCPRHLLLVVFCQLGVVPILITMFYALKWQVQNKGAKVSTLFASNWKSQSACEDKHQKTKNWVLVVNKAQGYLTLIVLKDDEADFY
jgi:hypothetical protein